MFELEINTKADSLISNGEIGPMIIVCPRIENSRGLNSSLISEEVPDAGYGNGIINLGRYEDYFMDEVVPLIDSKFNTITLDNGSAASFIESGRRACFDKEGISGRFCKS